MKKKILSILCIFICMITIAIPKSHATEIQNADIYYEYECDWVLQFLNPKSNVWTYVRTFYTVYHAPNGVKYPTYCLNSDKSGVGGIAGEVPSYTVSIDQQIEDDRIWRIITNGYPYKTPEELGVCNESDAFTATKHAIYSVLYDREVRNYYRASPKSEDLETRGEQVLQAIETLVDIGRNGTDTRIEGNISAIKIGEFQIEKEQYYSQEYKVKANAVIKEYEVAGLSNFPEGSIITDLQNQEKTKFEANENFKILIPIDKVRDNIRGEIYIQGECKTYPIFYGQSPQENLQNYAVCYDLYGTVVGQTDLMQEIKGKISIQKTAKENNIWTDHKKGDGVAGAKYELKDSQGNQIAIFTSNENGILIKDYELPIGKYTLTEISSPEYFQKDKNQYEISITMHKQEIELQIQEEVEKGGFVTIQKISQDKNYWNGKQEGALLPDAVYQIKNQKNETVYELVTNEKGTIEKPLKLELGNYTIQETKAPEFYILDDTIYEFKIEKNEQLVELKFQNKSKSTPKLPRTGF